MRGVLEAFDESCHDRFDPGGAGSGNEKRLGRGIDEVDPVVAGETVGGEEQADPVGTFGEFSLQGMGGSGGELDGAGFGAAATRGEEPRAALRSLRVIPQGGTPDFFSLFGIDAQSGEADVVDRSADTETEGTEGERVAGMIGHEDEGALASGDAAPDPDRLLGRVTAGTGLPQFERLLQFQ